MAAHDTPAARVGYVFRQMAAHDTPAAGLGTSSDRWRQTAFSWRYTKADLNAYLHRLAAHKPLNPAA